MKSNKKMKQNSGNRSGNQGGRRPKLQNNQMSRQGPLVKAPSNTSRVQTTGVARVTPIKDGVLACNRELIAGYTSTGLPFEVLDRFRVNPGSYKTFRWLSTIANSFETYRFKKLKFEYIARCSTASNGSLMLSPDYDARDGPPSNEAAASALKGTKEDNPWRNIVLELNPADMNRTFKGHFTMQDNRFNATNQDVKTIDAAQVFLCSDTSAPLFMGKLWVSYECELFTPQNPLLDPTQGGLDLQISQGTMNNTGTAPPITLGTSTISAVKQNVQDPLMDLTSFGTNIGGVNGCVVGKFLRDYEGIINLTTGNPNAGYRSGANQYCSTYNPTNALFSLLNNLNGGTNVGDNGGGVGSNINVRGSSYISALAGDFLTLPQFIGTFAGISTLPINIALAGMQNGLPFV